MHKPYFFSNSDKSVNIFVSFVDKTECNEKIDSYRKIRMSRLASMSTEGSK